MRSVTPVSTITIGVARAVNEGVGDVRLLRLDVQFLPEDETVRSSIR